MIYKKHIGGRHIILNLSKVISITGYELDERRYILEIHFEYGGSATVSFSKRELMLEVVQDLSSLMGDEK
jgi:hypothetical protein